MIKQMASDLSFMGRPVPVAVGTFLSTFLILEHYSTPWALSSMFALFEQNWRTLSYSRTIWGTMTFFVIWASLEQCVVFGMNACCQWNAFVCFTKLCFANLSRQFNLKWLFGVNVFVSASSNSLARFIWRVGERDRMVNESRGTSQSFFILHGSNIITFKMQVMDLY